ncbi:MAG: esterase-like activity of phytase family protein [Planctomycetota bacterium]
MPSLTARFALLCLFVFGGLASCGSTRTADRRVAAQAIRELSGLVAHPNGKSLYGVADNGVLVELDLKGRILKSCKVPGEDLEGITWGRNGELWLLSERNGHILRFDPKTFESRGQFSVPLYEEREGRNKSYEGIAFDGKTRIYLVNERPAVLVILEEKNERWIVVEERPLPAQRVNDLLLLSDKQGFVLLSRDRGLRLLDFEGRAQGEWYALEEINLEGLALVPNQGLFLASDQDPAVLISLNDFSGESALISILSKTP